MKHRADAYCPACGGKCRDEAAIKALADAGRKPLSLRPAFTGPGKPGFKPARRSSKWSAPGK